MRKMMKMMEEQKDLLSLSAGEAKFDAPPELIEMASRALHEGKNLYTSTNGIPQIREAIADFVEKKFGARVDPSSNILMTVGGMEAIYLAATIIIEAGDKVLLPDPGWGVIRTIMERKGAIVEYYPLDPNGGWTIDHEAILERMDEKTKMVVVNSPSNPTGALLGQEGFRQLMTRAAEIGVFVLSDEVYHNYVYEGEHASALNFGCPDNLIFINSFSKAFAVTGWRLGYAIADPWLIRQMGIYREEHGSCLPRKKISSPGQWIGWRQYSAEFQ